MLATWSIPPSILRYQCTASGSGDYAAYFFSSAFVLYYWGIHKQYLIRWVSNCHHELWFSFLCLFSSSFLLESLGCFLLFSIKTLLVDSKSVFSVGTTRFPFTLNAKPSQSETKSVFSVGTTRFPFTWNASWPLPWMLNQVSLLSGDHTLSLYIEC